MNHWYEPATCGSATTNYHMGSCQGHYTVYHADGGAGRTEMAAATAAEAAATAAAMAVAAANAAQEAAYAAKAVTENANAITSINHNFGRQGTQPFPARRRKLRPDDSWHKTPQQEGWRSFTWDYNRAQSHKKHSDVFNAERGSPSKSRSRLSKQRPRHHIQPQQQWRVKRNNYAEPRGHQGKTKDVQHGSIGYADVSGGKAGHAQHSSGKKTREAVANWLELPKEAMSMSTKTLSDAAKGSQMEPFHDEVQPQHVQFQ